ncbi:hypothetical protein P5V43_05375 [Mycobacteroides abscessus subsp. bolletii]|uniref:hypothetical protein n=1 Tax=Mycobacteroides abscessus TaxID=36809 RepID=UPI00266C605C|nr:hypothetical protein [Mycobacteroides abscessus]MDO3126529.1 hypothetical protein [Mycobacteroides abscessus subsp. bolletii]
MATIIDTDGAPVCEVELLPPDVETRVAELCRLDGPTQAARVTAMLSHARTGLLVAIAAQDLPQIVEWKQKASAIQEIAKQVRMGKEFQLDAAEFVRRAERGLGVAIRAGQERGEILARGERRTSANQFGVNGNTVSTKSSPTDFASRDELTGCNSDGIYGMTDDVSDEQFDQAIIEARGENNLSRANVAPKI